MAAGKPKVLIVDDDPDIRDFLKFHLQRDYEVVGVANNGRSGILAAQTLKPDFVLMDIQMPEMDGLEATRILSDQLPGVTTIVLSGRTDLDMVRSAMAVGAREYVFKPIQTKDLDEVLSRASRQLRERQRIVDRSTRPPGAGIWAFCSATGGVGQTTLLLSIANELLTLGKRVVVADLDFVFGTISFYLGIEGKGLGVNDLLEEPGFLDPEVLDLHLRRHTSGLRILAAPDDPFIGCRLDKAKVAQAIGALPALADYVLLDMPPGLPEPFLPVLDETQFIFLTAEGTPGSLRNLRTYVRVLREAKYPDEKVRPVLARHDAAHLDLETCRSVLSAVNSRLAHVFPSDPEGARHAQRRGQAVSRIAPESAYTQAIRDFLVPILELPRQEPKQGQNPGFLARIFG